MASVQRWGKYLSTFRRYVCGREVLILDGRYLETVFPAKQESSGTGLTHYVSIPAFAEMMVLEFPNKSSEQVEGYTRRQCSFLRGTFLRALLPECTLRLLG